MQGEHPDPAPPGQLLAGSWVVFQETHRVGSGEMPDFPHGSALSCPALAAGTEQEEPPGQTRSHGPCAALEP